MFPIDQHLVWACGHAAMLFSAGTFWASWRFGEERMEMRRYGIDGWCDACGRTPIARAVAHRNSVRIAAAVQSRREEGLLRHDCASDLPYAHSQAPHLEKHR